MPLLPKVDNPALRQSIRDLLATEPLFKYNRDISPSDKQVLTSERTKRFCQLLSEMVTPEDLASNRSITAVIFEELQYYDLSLAIKVGVHFGLAMCSILDIGNEQQAKKYLEGLLTFRTPSGFAMTELGGGIGCCSLRYGGCL